MDHILMVQCNIVIVAVIFLFLSFELLVSLRHTPALEVSQIPNEQLIHINSFLPAFLAQWLGSSKPPATSVHFPLLLL